MEQRTVQRQAVWGVPETRTDLWNPQKYYVDNLILGLSLAMVSLFLFIRFVGFRGFQVWVMVTTQVHFLISYLFHYQVLRRTLVTRAHRLAFGLTFFPLVCLFPVIYYSPRIPRHLADYLSAMYFIVHLVRDEHVLYVQRSSGFRRFALDRGLQANVILLVSAFAVLLFGNYSRGIPTPMEIQVSPFRHAPAWVFLVFLGAIPGVGLTAWYWAKGRTVVAFSRGAAYGLLLACAVLAFNRLVAPRIPIPAFYHLLIYYHVISWYIFGIERVLHASQAAQPAGMSAPAGHGTDPFWKFKKSPVHFLGLVLGAHVLLGFLYGLSRMELFQPLHILFNMKYMSLWAFPHITMHFYPKR